jgi:histone-binding protein RBBP4
MSAVVEEERDVREQYLAWKRLVPFLYDSFINHHLTWPSLSCRCAFLSCTHAPGGAKGAPRPARRSPARRRRSPAAAAAAAAARRWGPLVHESSSRRKQRLYLSEQTDGSEPNKLVLCTADVARPRVSSAEAVSTWGEQARSPHISGPLKTIVHPGEVNKLLDLPLHPSMVATHSDSPDVYVWNFDTQRDRAADLAGGAPAGRLASVADAVLKGHALNAEFALGASTCEPVVASGGKDAKVLLWSLADAESALAGGPTPKASVELAPRAELVGHSKTVEDVAFMPGSATQLASVADDFSLLFWDARSGAAPVARVARAHGERDVHCCDWSALRPTLVVTGAQDGGVRVWDKRNLGGALLVLNHHTDAAMNVEWSPHRPGLFASGADDGLVCVWDLDARAPDADGAGAAKRAKTAAPHQLLFQHAGHQSPVVDFCWDPADPWALMSASVDVDAGGGGTLQLWRVSDLVYRSDEEVLAELDTYKDFIVTGDESKLPPKPGGPLLPKREDGEAGDAAPPAHAAVPAAS